MHKPQHNPHIKWLIMLMAALVLLGIALPPPYASLFNNGQSYFKIHLVLELIAVLISALVAMVTWNSLSPKLAGTFETENEVYANRTLFGGFLIVVFMDLLHAMTFPGVDPLLQHVQTQKSIVYWLSGRMIELMTVCLIAFGVKTRLQRVPLLVIGLLVTLVIALLNERLLGYFPDFYIPGQGVTLVKSIMEYLIALGYFGVAIYLRLTMGRSSLRPKRLLAISDACIFMGLCEVALSHYLAPTDLTNFIGHLSKIISYVFIYRATFVYSFQVPYKRLLSAFEKNSQHKAELNTLIQALPIAVARLDVRLCYRYVNTSHEKLVGFEQQQIVGRHIDEVLPHGIREMARPYLLEALSGRESSFNYAINKVDDHQAHWLIKIVPDYDQNNLCLGVLMMIMDTTDHDVMEQKVKQSSREMADLNAALNAHAIVAFTDANGIITKVNDKFCQISKYTRKELIGRTHKVVNSGQHPESFFKHLWQVISSGNVWNGEICNRAKDGTLYWVYTTIVPLLDDKGVPQQYVSIRADITERKMAEERATYLALHDVLTGLANRRYMHNRLEWTLSNCARFETNGGLITLDLDNFRQVNDEYGHTVGDQLLIEVSSRLSSLVRKNDTVARLGGDEFVIVISDVGKDRIKAKAHMMLICDKINQSIKTPYALEGMTLHITTSMGCLIFNNNQQSLDTLFEWVDSALYNAKKQGKDNLVFYEG